MIIKYIPNILTISRFFFIPFIVKSLAENEYVLAIILYSLSSLTDVADGIIARKCNAISKIGKVHDPLADKSTQISVFLTLGFKGMVENWGYYYFAYKRFADDNWRNFFIQEGVCSF